MNYQKFDELINVKNFFRCSVLLLTVFLISTHKAAYAQVASNGNGEKEKADFCKRGFLGLPKNLNSKKFLWENDAGITDEDYTNGMKWERQLYPECSDYFGKFGDSVALFHDHFAFSRGNFESTVFGYSFGMNFYTPGDLTVEEHIPQDRPYSGWAYASLMHKNVGYFDDGERERIPLSNSKLEIMIGLLGDWAGQDEIQIAWHDLPIIDSTDPKGWENQQDGELGINAVYNNDYYFYSLNEHLRWTLGFGLSLGNVRRELKGRIGLGYSSDRLAWGFLDSSIIEPTIAAPNLQKTKDESALTGASLYSVHYGKREKRFKDISFFAFGLAADNVSEAEGCDGVGGL